MRKTLLFLLAVLTIAACKKNVTTPAPVAIEGTATLTFNNSLQDSVYLDISGHDILTGTIPHIFRITLAPEGAATLPHTEVKNSYRYYYTWHTKDYTYSSWYHTTASGQPMELFFDYYADSTDYILNINGVQRSELNVFLDNDGTTSLWKAVDAYDNTGASIWATLTDSAKNHRFTISKFHTVKHTFTKLGSKEASNTLFFSLPKEADLVSLTVQHPADSFILTQNAAPYANLSTSANDTLFYIFQKNRSYNPPYYKLARIDVTR